MKIRKKRVGLVICLILLSIFIVSKVGSSTGNFVKASKPPCGENERLLYDESSGVYRCCKERESLMYIDGEFVCVPELSNEPCDEDVCKCNYYFKIELPQEICRRIEIDKISKRFLEKEIFGGKGFSSEIVNDYPKVEDKYYLVLEGINGKVEPMFFQGWIIESNFDLDIDNIKDGDWVWVFKGESNVGKGNVEES